MTDLENDPDDEEGPSNYRTCEFCLRNWGDHEHTCPYAPTLVEYDDLAWLGRLEDRVFGDPRETEVHGP